LIFCSKVFGTKVLHAVKLILRLIPRVEICRRGLLMDVEGRLLPNYVVVTSEVLKEVLVSYNILSVSVPNDALRICTMVQFFTSGTIVSITKNVVIICRQC
jgi:hypothetical protein